MQISKGTWCMREQCVPGSLSSSPAQEPGNKATTTPDSHSVTARLSRYMDFGSRLNARNTPGTRPYCNCLGRIFHCYIWERSQRSDGYCLRVQGKPKLPRRRPRVPASAFSTVVVSTPCDFF